MKNRAKQGGLVRNAYVESDKIINSKFRDLNYSVSPRISKKEEQRYSEDIEFIVDWYQVREDF